LQKKETERYSATRVGTKEGYRNRKVYIGKRSYRSIETGSYILEQGDTYPETRWYVCSNREGYTV
jgi:hypothetical protein